MIELFLKNISGVEDQSIKIEVNRELLKLPMNNLGIRDVNGEFYEISLKKHTYSDPISSTNQVELFFSYYFDESTSEEYIHPTKILIGSKSFLIKTHADVDVVALQIQNEIPVLSVDKENGFKIILNDLLADPIPISVFVIADGVDASVAYDLGEVYFKTFPMGATFLLVPKVDCRLSEETSVSILTRYDLQPGDWVLKDLLTDEVLSSGTITSEDISNFNTLSKVCEDINNRDLPIKAIVAQADGYFTYAFIYNISETDTQLLNFSLNNAFSDSEESYSYGVDPNKSLITHEDSSMSFCLKSLSEYHTRYSDFKNESHISLKNTFFQYSDSKPVVIGFALMSLDEDLNVYETFVNYLHIDPNSYILESGVIKPSKILEEISYRFNILTTTFVKPTDLLEDFSEEDYSDDIYVNVYPNDPADSPLLKVKGPFKIQFISTNNPLISDYIGYDHYDWVGLNYPTEEDQMELVIGTPTIHT